MNYSLTGGKMLTMCPYCKKEIQWCYARSVVYNDEEDSNEIQCPHCEKYILVD